MGLLDSGPWLVDDDGNDVFDSVNSPTESAHIFDPINVENSLDRFGDGAGDVGAIVDDVDSGIRGIGQYAGGSISDTGGDVFSGISTGYEDGTLPDGSSPAVARGLSRAAVLAAIVFGIYTVGQLLNFTFHVGDGE